MLEEIWIYYNSKIPNNNVIEVQIQTQLKYTFQQRSLAWPIHRKAPPRHPVFPPVQRNKKKDRCQHIMTFDSLVLTSRAIFYFFFLKVVSAGLCLNSDIWSAVCSLQWHPGGPMCLGQRLFVHSYSCIANNSRRTLQPAWQWGQGGYFTFTTEGDQTRHTELLFGWKLHQTNTSTCRQRIWLKAVSHTHQQWILDSGYKR